MNKTVIFLIGPKGSGKTHIGTVLEAKTGTPFLRVEPIWLSLKPGQDGWKEVEKAIDSELETQDQVIIESLGGSEGFESLRRQLGKKYSLRYVRIKVPLDVCLDRVRGRNPENHIPISDDKVEQYNRIAAQVSLPWDIEIENHPPLSDREILKKIQHLTLVYSEHIRSPSQKTPGLENNSPR